jgi:hypothetical protein
MRSQYGIHNPDQTHLALPADGKWHFHFFQILTITPKYTIVIELFILSSIQKSAH